MVTTTIGWMIEMWYFSIYILFQFQFQWQRVTLVTHVIFKQNKIMLQDRIYIWIGFYQNLDP